MAQVADDIKTLTGRILGLPSVARLALFSRHEGPAILLTTTDRLEHFRDSDVFGAPASINPTLADWQDKFDKVVLSINHALKPFPKNPEGFALNLERNKSYPREALLEQLVRFGYERDELPGFSVRGDTVTIFLDAEDTNKTLKLEFFADDLETLEHEGKRVDRFTIAPLENADIEQETWDSKILENLPGKIFLDASELFEGNVEDDVPDVLQSPQMAWLWEHLAKREVISFGRDKLELAPAKVPYETLGYYRAKLSDFRSDVETWLKDKYSVTLLLKFERTGRYLRERVIDGLESHWHNFIKFHPGQIGLVIAPNARGGYRNPETKEIIITEELLYGYQGARKAKKLPGKSVHDAVQLSVGDFLIHPDHGIGQFMGLEPRQVVGVTRDYLLLKYAGEGKLYLPVEQLPLLRRHPGTTDDPPRLSTLGTNEWARAREKARVSAQELAMKLIRTYAERQVTKGISLPEVPGWDKLIEENCPFTLTVDQQKAVQAVYKDLAREVPMDRLISGDVGFGKTEVAIRAAHRVVGNSKQVAMLVPTTILAAQHYETFAERFKGLPVNVAMLSRFTSDKEAREITKAVKEGKVDIVVGTHRLLNEGLQFKDLGLVIIDEEHRFGVGQKEKLKSLKANIDVLSLSATPIPRTLYMSLVGLRDVSQIMTPPSGRKPIQTVLQPYDPMIAREAIMFELERGGKTFYIHDRVGSIGLRTRALQQLVPEARFGVAHGQMNADDLEEIMLGFQEGAFDVLVATTIVESGLDIAGANTLVIERADKLGLAQLYQLRGRVGRRQTEAWAYLFYPGRITEQAQRRLYAIAELNDLGSGHLLAEKDMEIRGVGNLLGPEQHGNISAVSLEVYTEMLAEEIAKLKGEQKAEQRNVAIDLSIDARLSPSYIQNDELRIEYYGRLSEAEGLAEVVRIAKQLREEFGPMPNEVKAFIDLVKLRILALEKNVTTIKETMTEIQITFDISFEALDYDAKALKELPFGVEPTRYPPGFKMRKRGLKPEEMLEAISRVLYLVG
jgi:transcription-repair coupling factor (superfamily II helicase)